MSNTSLDHPIIGTVTGNLRDGIAQFFGIRYAALSDRFAPPEVVKYDKTGLRATEFGPQVIGPPSGVDREMAFIQQTLPKPTFPDTSELDGLNLNISIPESALHLRHEKKLPVFVFIHGGSFAIGAHWWPQYNTAALVKLSEEQNSSTVAVNINYRTGTPGFLTTPELRKEGYKVSNGLRDQFAALTWIQQYIPGFGGDAENVTVGGQSAGGVSAGLLLFSEKPLAKRLLLLGGCPPLSRSLPMPVADKIGHAATDAIGVNQQDAVQSLLKLRGTFCHKSSTGSLPMLPVVDGDIVPEVPTFQTLTSRLAHNPWCEAIMLGYSELDASIFASVSLLQRKGDIGAAFRKSAAHSLFNYPEHILQDLLEHYQLSESHSKDDDADLMSILRFANDICFFAPAIELAAYSSAPAYVFYFNEPNPWSGPFQGHASHILDVAFLFQNFNALLGKNQRAGAVQLGADVIKFVNGEAPWKAFKKDEHRVTVYADGEKTYSEPPEFEKSGRTPFVFHFTQGGRDRPTLDDLMKVFTDFLSGE